MSYATVAQLRSMLGQIPAGAGDDAALQDLLDRATGRIDLKLGFSFAAYGTAADKDVLQETASEYLRLPSYQAGSINTTTGIKYLYSKGTTGESTENATDWEELDDGRVYRYSGWSAGWYRVNAKWGHDEAPAEAVQLCLEVARDLWFQRDASTSSNTVGIEGAGAVATRWAWTAQQWEVIQQLRLQHGEFGMA